MNLCAERSPHDILPAWYINLVNGCQGYRSVENCPWLSSKKQSAGIRLWWKAYFGCGPLSLWRTVWHMWLSELYIVAIFWKGLVFCFQSLSWWACNTIQEVLIRYYAYNPLLCCTIKNRCGTITSPDLCLYHNNATGNRSHMQGTFNWKRLCFVQ